MIYFLFHIAVINFTEIYYVHYHSTHIHICVNNIQLVIIGKEKEN